MWRTCSNCTLSGLCLGLFGCENSKQLLLFEDRGTNLRNESGQSCDQQLLRNRVFHVPTCICWTDGLNTYGIWQALRYSPHTGQILRTTTTNKDDTMFLQIVTLTRDVRLHRLAVA